MTTEVVRELETAWSSDSAAERSWLSSGAAMRRWPSAASAWSPIASAVAIAARRFSIGRSGFAQVIGDERVHDECRSRAKARIVGGTGEFFGLEEPAMRVGRPSLALVDVAEQEQCLRFDLRATELGRLLRHLEQLVASPP